MTSTFTEARTPGVWHRLPPLATVMLGLAVGLYGVLEVWFVEWARAHAADGPFPAFIWAELVGLPGLIGALHLVAGVGIWRARLRAHVVGAGAAERGGWTRRADIGVALLGMLWGSAAVGGAVWLLGNPPSALGISPLTIWLTLVGAPATIGVLHLTLARGVRRKWRGAQAVAAAVAGGYLLVTFYLILLILGLTESYYQTGKVRASDLPFDVIFMISTTLITAICTFILYALRREA